MDIEKLPEPQYDAITQYIRQYATPLIPRYLRPLKLAQALKYRILLLTCRCAIQRALNVNRPDLDQQTTQEALKAHSYYLASYQDVLKNKVLRPTVEKSSSENIKDGQWEIIFPEEDLEKTVSGAEPEINRLRVVEHILRNVFDNYQWEWPRPKLKVNGWVWPRKAVEQAENFRTAFKLLTANNIFPNAFNEHSIYFSHTAMTCYLIDAFDAEKKNDAQDRIVQFIKDPRLGHLQEITGVERFPLEPNPKVESTITPEMMNLTNSEYSQLAKEYRWFVAN